MHKIFKKKNEPFKSTSFFSQKKVFMELESKASLHPHLNLPRLHNVQLRRWFDSLTSHEMEVFKKHNFDNLGSLLKAEINWWLIEGLVARWDDVNRVFRFGMTELCPPIKEDSLSRGTVKYKLYRHSSSESRFKVIDIQGLGYQERHFRA